MESRRDPDEPRQLGTPLVTQRTGIIPRIRGQHSNRLPIQPRQKGPVFFTPMGSILEQRALVKDFGEVVAWVVGFGAVPRDDGEDFVAVFGALAWWEDGGHGPAV